MDTRTGAEVGTIRRLAESFEIALRARNLSDRTLEGYVDAVGLFGLGFTRPV